MCKTMLITGSSRGIGASIARLAASAGYDVILHGKKESFQLKEFSRTLSSRYLIFDVTNEHEIKKSFSKINRIDVLVNSAGINISKPFSLIDSEDWNQIYNINVLGLATVIKHALPLLKSSSLSARIINIASVKGTYSAVGRVAYASSKAAVINLTTGLAKELAPGILVNAVSPGFVDTDMTSATWSDRIKKQVDSILLGRMATPEEIANVVLFLSGESSSYITGQNIIVDGGFGIKND